jgi:hypothetical protein
VLLAQRGRSKSVIISECRLRNAEYGIKFSENLKGSHKIIPNFKVPAFAEAASRRQANVK